MDKNTLASTKALLIQDFELENIELGVDTEEELIKALAKQMDFLLDRRTEFLFSLMYRLDVDESKVSAALSPIAPEPAHIGLARLVFERQKQRVFTKQHYKQEKIDDMDW